MSALGPSFWKTVRILLVSARTRASGRRRRQSELLQQRSGRASSGLTGLGSAMAFLLAVAVNIMAAFLVMNAFEAAQPGRLAPKPAVQAGHKVAVSQAFLDGVNRDLNDRKNYWRTAEESVEPALYESESRRIAARTGQPQDEVERLLHHTVHDTGAKGFIVEVEPPPPPAKPQAIGYPRRLPDMLGSLVLLVWFLMLIFQGEGLEMDLQQRRHPMWEWLFSHPVSSGAVFLAEMLLPIAANPIYWGAPLFVGFLYGLQYGFLLGLLAVVLMGVPMAVATACAGKAFEIAAVIRFPPRTRGAIIGIMGWLGYASLMFFFLGTFLLPGLIPACARFLLFFTVVPWPYLRWFTGGLPDGTHSFALGMAVCWTLAAVMSVAAVRFSIWGAAQGLSGNFAADSRPSQPGDGGARFSKRPLYRKELLWFRRDRSAIVQTILIPLTVAGVQVVNLRGLAGHAGGAWNYLCGAAILFGTYFLWILGPKSLSSEGNALWIAMTWPQGLEGLLKAKAWLWSLISTGMFGLVLCFAFFLFPAESWKILLVALGWLVFSRSMAEKSVTLVTITSPSGEIEKIPAGRRYAAQLGMLTFAIGIMTQQWHIAIMGIVYSYITAAAMWQNFRAHLPYLYDPWSETLPPPPTLMHAMVAISILVEGGAVVASLLLAIVGRGNLVIAESVGYAICGLAVAIGVSRFLERRDVFPREVWAWLPKSAGDQNTEPWWRGYGPKDGTLLTWLAAGLAGGLLLGLFAHGYIALLLHFPVFAQQILKSREQMAEPGVRLAYAFAAVLCAPFAEEYLFRGLLFRALDREWGGWRAILGSAAFFAIYHPPMSWLPVGVLGVCNAVLFKKSGRLAPAVILHTVYNLVVLIG